MNVSYEGIGQWAATFACDGVSAGQVVKVSGNGTVAKCADNDGFEGGGVVRGTRRQTPALWRMGGDGWTVRSTVPGRFRPPPTSSVGYVTFVRGRRAGDGGSAVGTVSVTVVGTGDVRTLLRSGGS